MRLGRVEFNIGYVVDLDNEDMVEHAKQSVMDDIDSAQRHGCIIGIEKEGDYSENDIPEFLLETEED